MIRKFFHSIVTDQANSVDENSCCCVMDIGRRGMIGLLKAFLWFLSCLYFLLIKAILFLYRTGVFKQYHLMKPVVSIGNITWGGSGKTPLVVFVAQMLKERGLKPVILTRGYMAGTVASSQHNRVSDEAKMLEKALGDVPVLVGPNRIKNAQGFAPKNPVDVFLLDDGFQHWRLFRDLDIVAIDTTNPWGNGYLIPRGILREPVTSLARASLFVLTKTDLGKTQVARIKDRLKSLAPGKPVVEAVHQPVRLMNLRSKVPVDLTFLKGKKICSFCSIATPQSFEQTLTFLGADIKQKIPFIDHYHYNNNDVELISRYCHSHDLTTVVTTSKDAVKIGPFLPAFQDNIDVFSLEIKTGIVHGQDELVQRIQHIL